MWRNRQLLTLVSIIHIGTMINHLSGLEEMEKAAEKDKLTNNLNEKLNLIYSVLRFPF